MLLWRRILKIREVWLKPKTQCMNLEKSVKFVA